MPFADASFDDAYSIEAFYHALRLPDIYGEVFWASFRTPSPVTHFGTGGCGCSRRCCRLLPLFILLPDLSTCGNTMPALGILADDDVVLIGEILSLLHLDSEPPPFLPRRRQRSNNRL
jgi:hypothetical protein